MSSPDPVAMRLREVILPALSFRGTYLSMAVESLRQIAGRALEKLPDPIAGGVSVVISADAKFATQRINLDVPSGTNVLDALGLLAAQAGLVAHVLPLGIALLDPALSEIAEGFDQEPLTESTPTYDDRRAIAEYPALAIPSTAANAAFQEAAQTWPDALSGKLTALELADLLFVGIPGLPGSHNLQTEVLPITHLPPATPPQGQSLN